VFASYGPKDYEILFLDMQPGEAEGLVQKLVEAFAAAGLDAQAALAWYPKDGRTGDALLAAANASLKRTPGKAASAEPIAPNANGMERVRTMAARAASSNINVLILGESGVGKDVLARTIHQLSPRAGKPFVALNCASLPENLLESELFGHDKGAFTNAATAKVGLFESANGGTVFLDEIGEMPMTMQAKLLQAIERREIRPVGAVKARPIDVRFLSATNVDIEVAVARGSFRRDLMYRLNTLTLAVPPLRERREEIPGLVTMFVNEATRDIGREGLAVSDEAMDCLLAYRWPGNIRELRNAIERAVVLSDGKEILPDHLPLEKMCPPPGELVELAGRSPGAVPTSRLATTLPPLSDPKAAAERQRILDALETHVWSQTRAAAALKMSRRTLISKLDRYGIPRPQKRQRDDDADAADSDPGLQAGDAADRAPEESGDTLPGVPRGGPRPAAVKTAGE
jgi:DNA-binding NtrC family response regulator